MKKYVCAICGYVYDEAAGIADMAIAPGTKWSSLPESWVCPLCGAAKSDFDVQDETPRQKSAPSDAAPVGIVAGQPAPGELSQGELSALFSNLARGCEKQYLAEESALFLKLADYFKRQTLGEPQSGIAQLLALVEQDLSHGYKNANSAASACADRGALRALVWGEKVSRILSALLTRYEKEGESMLERTSIHVCDTCGFVYVGDLAPELCPVCKVPRWKILKVERRRQA